MNVLDYLKQEFDKAETFADMKLLPWLETLLAKIEHDAVTMAVPYVATAAAELGTDLTSGKPAAEILTDMGAVAQETVKKLASVGVSLAATDTAMAVNSLFTQAKPAAAPTATP